MKQPTSEQISEIIKIVSSSLDDLIYKDSDIFNIDIEIPEDLSPEAKALSRELHEITINHRLAVYIENHIQYSPLNAYCVDIEYNRYYESQKLLNTSNGQFAVRPDIIVHRRMNKDVDPQHYLVIEAKKDKISTHDYNKIIGFINDANYNYLFGLTISYCGNPDKVLANLYYYSKSDIIEKKIAIPKFRRRICHI